MGGNIHAWIKNSPKINLLVSEYVEMLSQHKSMAKSNEEFGVEGETWAYPIPIALYEVIRI